jgi:hypothetical protein
LARQGGCWWWLKYRQVPRDCAHPCGYLVDKGLPRGDNRWFLVDEKRILKGLSETPCGLAAEAVEILSPPKRQAASEVTQRRAASAGQPDLVRASGLGGRLSLSRRPLSNRQVRAMVGPREAPASHTCRGLTAVCARRQPCPGSRIVRASPG